MPNFDAIALNNSAFRFDMFHFLCLTIKIMTTWQQSHKTLCDCLFWQTVEQNDAASCMRRMS